MAQRGVNSCTIIGNVGNDPETRYTQSGVAVTRISVATTSVRKDRDGNQQERTEWHRVVLFGKLGEIAGEYLRKGSQVYIQGEIRYDKYTDSNGNERHTTDIVANEMQMLGGRSDSGSNRESQAQASASSGGGRGAPQRQRQQPAAQQAAAPAGFDDWGQADDEVPF